MEPRAAFKTPAIWALSFSVGGVIGLLNAGSEIIDVITGGEGTPLWQPVAWELTSNLTIAFLVPFVVEFALRFRFVTLGRGAALIAHAGAMVGFWLLHVAGMVGLRHLLYLWIEGQYDFGDVGLELLYEGFKDYVTYGLIVGLTYGFDYYRKYRQRELQTAQLQANLANARLENLEHRIQPHFLFNTLNMISATMHEDVDVADSMITRLSDLLRMSIDRRGRQEIKLSEELAMLEAYVEIMRARFEQRLTVDIQAEDGTANARVPPLILQPLVENAIKFGVAERDDDGHVAIHIRKNGSQLLLQVLDDGPGAGDAGPALLGKGVGLSTTAERLKRMYGERHSFTIENGETGGLRLSITIPFSTAPSDAAAEGADS